MSSTSIKLDGVIVEKQDDIQKFSDNFEKRSLWLRIDENTQYPQTVEVEFINKNIGLASKYNTGDSVVIDANVCGKIVELKDGTKRVFNSLRAWRISGIASGDASQDDSAGTPEDTDDLPF